ncbi:MAG TPA: ComF family protein [Rhizomicrobium sp.]|jgi:ComF family protein
MAERFKHPVSRRTEAVRRTLLDLLFPPLCIVCRVPVADPHHLCARCWNRIGFLEEPLCVRCGFPFEYDTRVETHCAVCSQDEPAFDRARALMRYDEASRDPILALKRADRLDLVPAFARWLRRAGRELIAQSDLIVPVPLHRRRLWQRRFNQSAVLALSLGRLSGKPVSNLALVRLRATPSQGDMPSASARRRNVSGAFRVAAAHRPAVRDKAILLIDDVFTTGATIDACARALKRGGARKVFVLTLARVVRPTSVPI